MIVVKKEKEKVNKEITRNNSIVDEVIDLKLVIENTREIIIDNLMFDYLIREEEIKSLIKVCLKADVNYEEVIEMIQIESVRFLLLKEGIDREEIDKMTWDDVANSLIRVHKRLILSKIKKEFLEVYFMVLERAKKTTDKILEGIY